MKTKLILVLMIFSIIASACTTEVPDKPQGWQPYPSAAPVETGLPAVRTKIYGNIIEITQEQDP